MHILYHLSITWGLENFPRERIGWLVDLVRKGGGVGGGARGGRGHKTSNPKSQTSNPKSQNLD